MAADFSNPSYQYVGHKVSKVRWIPPSVLGTSTYSSSSALAIPTGYFVTAGYDNTVRRILSPAVAGSTVSEISLSTGFHIPARPTRCSCGRPPRHHSLRERKLWRRVSISGSWHPPRILVEESRIFA